MGNHKTDFIFSHSQFMNTKLANPKGSAQCTSWGEIEIQPLDFLFLNLQMFVILIKPEGLHSTLQKHSSSYPSSCLTSHSSLANGYMDFCQHCSTDVALVKVAINQLVNPTASTYSCPHPSLSCWCGTGYISRRVEGRPGSVPREEKGALAERVERLQHAKVRVNREV